MRRIRGWAREVGGVLWGGRLFQGGGGVRRGGGWGWCGAGDIGGRGKGWTAALVRSRIFLGGGR